MRKFTLSFALAAAIVGASAQTVKGPAALVDMAGSQTFVTAKAEQNASTQKKEAQKRVAFNKIMMKEIAGPGVDDKVIDETPEGTLRIMEKDGFSYGYSWLTGMVTQWLSGSVSRMVTSPDGKKMYLQNPISFFFDSEENWIEGDVEGDILTFHFPQFVSYTAYKDKDGNITDEFYDYAVKLEFVASDEDGNKGWYYPCEDQSVKFRILPDGSLESLEERCMVGQCNWTENEDTGNWYWAWQGNGDIITDMKPVCEEPQYAVPSSLEMEEWQLISGLTSRSVHVGIDGDRMYITDLCNRSGMYDVPVVGTIDGGKVTFASSQYMGVYWDLSSVLYFLGGHMATGGEPGEEYDYFAIDPYITFDFDSKNNILQSDGSYCISCSSDKVFHIIMESEPYITKPSSNYVVESLQTPVVTSYYDYDEEDGSEAEVYFNFPTVDADRHILDTTRLYYRVFMDNELFTFYNDEYELPEGVEETTEIPFGYESIDTWDFGWYGGIKHMFGFHTLGFENLGVQTIYKGDDKTLYSEIAWCPGREGTIVSVEKVNDAASIESVMYFDLNGVRVAQPENGIFVKQTVYADGMVRTVKVVRK